MGHVAVASDAESLRDVEHPRVPSGDAIVESSAEKRLIVAGPGTGKTYTFEKALSKAITGSGTAQRGLSLTFIREVT